MADYKLTAALNAAEFPLVTRNHQRSVIIGQFDGKLRNPSSNPYNNLDNNPQNIPQLLYCENVMPTDFGIESVGYTALSAALPGAGTIDDVFVIRAGGSTIWYYAPAQGMNYIMQENFVGGWVSTSPVAGAPLAGVKPVSIAEVNGITYVLISGTAVLVWTGAAFTNVTATILASMGGGLTASSLLACCSSNNYLVIVRADGSVAWSSLTSPLDFTPSAATGAGAQIPIDIRGLPKFLSSTSGGFMIHCSDNTVAAVYSQNTASPWIFREIRNSGGVANSQDVSKEGTNNYVFQIGTAGLQQLDLRAAEAIHNQVSDFLSLGVYETFSAVTNLLTLTTGATLYAKITFLAGRYLCISYGLAANSYDYILIYDNVVKRWGKLKVSHADMLTQPGVSQGTSLLIVSSTGVVSRVVFHAGTGIAILGRYQLSRGVKICSQELELEVQDANDAPTVTLAVNYNGTTVGQLLAMTLYSATDNYRIYQKQFEAENLSYIINGKFALVTALLTVTKGAKY